MHTPDITYRRTNDSDEYVSCTSGEEEEECELDHQTEPRARVQGPMKIEKLGKSIARNRRKAPKKAEKAERVKRLGIESLSRLQMMHKQQHNMRLFIEAKAKGKEAYDHELMKGLQFSVKRLGERIAASNPW